MKTVIEMARESGLRHHIPFFSDSHVAVALHRFANLVRADEREACLNCYSPDDTATDWADKIQARSNT